MSRYISFAMLVFVINLLISCNENTTESVANKLYTPLSLGDKTQIIFMADSSTVSLEIVAMAERSDGQKVYQGHYKPGTQAPNVSYYYVADGYFMATALDTIQSDTLLHQINPFREQRLAKSYPKINDSWVHTIGDSSSGYFIAGDAGDFAPLWGAVADMFRFDLYDKDEAIPFMSVYYGPEKMSPPFYRKPNPNFTKYC